tara:strand:+ start:386 stop:697 length:312 start_codon:yes stop_codon:yes gene_type:complete
MDIYTKIGKRTIKGKKRTIYKKKGSQKLYLKCKGRMMNVTKYNKIKTTKNVKKPSKSKKVGGTPTTFTKAIQLQKNKIKGSKFKIEINASKNKLSTHLQKPKK